MLILGNQNPLDHSIISWILMSLFSFWSSVFPSFLLLVLRAFKRPIHIDVAPFTNPASKVGKIVCYFSTPLQEVFLWVHFPSPPILKMYLPRIHALFICLVLTPVRYWYHFLICDIQLTPIRNLGYQTQRIFCTLLYSIYSLFRFRSLDNVLGDFFKLWVSQWFYSSDFITGIVSSCFGSLWCFFFFLPNFVVFISITLVLYIAFYFAQK